MRLFLSKISIKDRHAFENLMWEWGRCKVLRFLCYVSYPDCRKVAGYSEFKNRTTSLSSRNISVAGVGYSVERGMGDGHRKINKLIW